MMTRWKWINILPGLSLIMFCAQPVASEYVPPPTGPYQSSVIISSGESSSAQQSQVYKFPPADLIPSISDADRMRKPAWNHTQDREKRDAIESFDPATGASDYASSISQHDSSLMPQNFTNQPAYQQNPWSYPDQHGYPNQGYSGSWGQPSYPYYQQYPNGYTTPYNNSNNPFSNMPSPWSSMPVQPFFSGNKR